jgi:hypothetical protein
MRMVTGHAGPGAGGAATLVDASSHSWNGTVGDYRSSRVAGEQFDSTNPSDIGHRWTRWAGYPEREGDARPHPVLLDPLFKNGKFSMASVGSNIQPGVTLQVETAASRERFTPTLARKTSRWQVKRKTRSAPGGLAIASIWGDGRPHRVRLVNPDGASSEWTELSLSGFTSILWQDAEAGLAGRETASSGPRRRRPRWRAATSSSAPTSAPPPTRTRAGRT